jgi:hypothetical protein
MTVHMRALAEVAEVVTFRRIHGSWTASQAGFMSSLLSCSAQCGSPTANAGNNTFM